MVHPFLWPFAAAGGLLLKKATLYAVASNYAGFPRLYRRLLEQNRRLTPESSQWIVKEGLKMSLRSPTDAYVVFRSVLEGRTVYNELTGMLDNLPEITRDSRLYGFFERIVEQQQKQNPVLTQIASTIIGTTKVGKNLKELDKFAKQKRRRS